MSISIQCPTCEKKLKAKDELAGKRIKCPNCGEGVVIPSADPASQRVSAKGLSPIESPPRRGQKAVTSPAPSSRRLHWPWYAGGGVALLCALALVVFIFAMPGKERTPANKEVGAVPPVGLEGKPEPKPD